MSLFRRPKISIPSPPPPPPQPTMYVYPWGRQVLKEIPTTTTTYETVTEPIYEWVKVGNINALRKYDPLWAFREGVKKVGDIYYVRKKVGERTKKVPVTKTTYHKAWVFEESPEAKEARLQREALKKKLLSELGVISPEREKQLEEFAKQYQEELLRYAQPKLEQALIGRGLGGSSIYKEAISDLIRRAAQEAVLEKEQLKRADEAAKLAALQAVESGLSAEAARALQAAQLASTDLARRAAIQRAIWSGLLGAQLAQAKLGLGWQQGLLGSGSNIISSIILAAALGHI